MAIKAKGEIVINPKTQRPVKVGGRIWRKLVKEGILEGRYADPKELYEIKDPSNVEEVEEKIEELNKELPMDTQAVRGRGRYKNKIVKRSKPASSEDVTRHTIKKAVRTVSDNLEDLNECDDLEAELEKLIMDELLAPAKPKQKPKKKTLKKYETDTEYEADDFESEIEYDADSDNDDEYYDCV